VKLKVTKNWIKKMAKLEDNSDITVGCVDVILDFCAGCGSLLSTGLGLEKEPMCYNCNTWVKDRTSRIQGTFTRSEADKLMDIFF